MANWSAFTLTDKGLALQAKVNAGSTELKFTKFVIGSGVPSGTINAITELAHKEMDVPINQISVEKNTVTMSGVITNTGVSVGFTLQEFGLNATDPDEGEILYGVMTDPNPDFIPAEGTATVVSQEFELHLTVSNTGNVSAVLDPTALVTKAMLDAHDANESAHQKAFEKHNKDEAAHPFLLKKITTDISTHNSATNAHLDIRQKITDDIATHNTDSNAHSNFDWVKTMSAASDGLHFRTRNASADSVLNLINTLQATLNQGTAPTGNNGTVLELLSGIVHQIKALSGKTNWWETPKDSFETLSAGIVAGDVSDTNAWWVKFGGTIPLIIQGIYIPDSAASQAHELSFPISFNSPIAGFATIDMEKPITGLMAAYVHVSDKDKGIFIADQSSGGGVDCSIYALFIGQ